MLLHFCFLFLFLFYIFIFLFNFIFRTTFVFLEQTLTAHHLVKSYRILMKICANFSPFYEDFDCDLALGLVVGTKGLFFTVLSYKKYHDLHVAMCGQVQLKCNFLVTP